MTDIDSIKRRITAISNSIATAKGAIGEESEINLAGLEKAIEEICAEITDVAAGGDAEGKALLPPLLVLIDEVGRLEETMKGHHEMLAKRIDNLTSRQQATQAYGDTTKSPPKSAPKSAKNT